MACFLPAHDIDGQEYGERLFAPARGRTWAFVSWFGFVVIGCHMLSWLVMARHGLAWVDMGWNWGRHWLSGVIADRPQRRARDG